MTYTGVWFQVGEITLSPELQNPKIAKILDSARYLELVVESQFRVR